MLRKAMLFTAILGLLLASALLGGGSRADASPLAQATATPEHEEGAHGERIDPGGATIRIVEPADGATIEGRSATVRVEVTNFTLGEGNHWHVYVDGRERGMSEGASTTQIVNDLEPGEHEIEVVPSNTAHQELDTTDTIAIRVGGEEGASRSETGPASASPGDALLIAGAVLAGIIVIAGAGILFGRRK